MSRRKTERLLNLVICLLNTRRYLTVDEIREKVPQYAADDGGDDVAFRRMFERDKEELRDLGIPLETGLAPMSDDPGYRIPPTSYRLPDIRLEPDEAAAVALAVQAWQSAQMSSAAETARVKLSAAAGPAEADGETAVDARAFGMQPWAAGGEPALKELLGALAEGRTVRFDYRTAAGEGPARRTVDPWGVASWRGRWYLVAHDRDRAAQRVFRLDRVTGPVQVTGRPVASRPPADLDVAAEVAAYVRDTPQRTAVLRVAPGRAGDLRRDADEPVEQEDGWAELRLSFGDIDRLADRLAWYGDGVVVREPADLRDAVLVRLRAALQAQPAGAGGGR